MKGIELLATVLALLMMIGATAFLGGIIIFVLNAAYQPTTSKITYEMFLSSIYPPIKDESILLSYLETTDEPSGFQVKKILTYAAYQRNITNVFVEGKEVTTLGATTLNVFSLWLKGNGYILALNIDGYPYFISDNRRAFKILPDNMLKLKRISVPVYIDVESIKKIKTYRELELPISVTLDLYVQ